MIVKIKTYGPDEFYLKVHQKTIRDGSLSFRARGLLCWALSNSENFQINVSHIIKQSPSEKRTAIRSALKELVSKGYFHLTKSWDKQTKKINGSAYVVYERPELNPHFKTEKTKNKQTEELSAT